MMRIPDIEGGDYSVRYKSDRDLYEFRYLNIWLEVDRAELERMNPAEFFERYMIPFCECLRRSWVAVGAERERSSVVLELSQDEAQTLAAYIRLHPHPGPLMRGVRVRIEHEIQEGLERELDQCATGRGSDPSAAGPARALPGHLSGLPQVPTDDGQEQ